ncbi:MAG: nucleoside kinase [Bacteroidaceae bacterium]|nr:nucleoside kinase [Bacteroidaceae bacterium]
MNTQTVTIRLKNNNTKLTVPMGSTLWDVYQQSGLQMEFGPVSARVNNKVQGLKYCFYNSKDVEFLDLTSPSGMRVYERSLFLVLAKAVEDVFPGGRLIMGAPLCGGHYCELFIGRRVSKDDIKALDHRMREIVEADMNIHRVQCPIEEAIAMFRAKGMESKALLLEEQGNLYTYYYRLGDTIDYFYSCLLGSTGKLKTFELTSLPVPEQGGLSPVQSEEGVGLLLRTPSLSNPNELAPIKPEYKMLDVIREHHRWQNILGVSTVGELNAAVRQGRATELINVSEALQEKKLSAMADEIVARGAKLVLIAGPSSSGKTTTGKRLSILMMACGLHPHTICTDDYFVNRVDTPKDANGEYDFECIEAVDTAFFQKQMTQLLAGEEVELPRYDFPSGERVFEGRKLKIGSNDVIILEGNHALNPLFSQQIREEDKYRIYVSACTTVALDDHNYVPTIDIRLLRRILRDYNYRGYSALETIKRCPSVTAGEGKWITPYQENADATFNSALLFELGVLRTEIMPILEQVSERAPEYSEASRLRKFLRYFRPIPASEVPRTSLLREFMGGSSFNY